MLRLVPQADGSFAVICVEDLGEDLNQNDATMRHRLSDTANVAWNRRLNAINRRRWARTKDWSSTVPTTLYRHKNLKPGERLTLEGPDEQGGYSLVLFSPSRDLTTEPLPGTGTRAKQDNRGTMRGPQAWSSAPGGRPGELDVHEIQDAVRTGDSRAPVMTLAKLNQMHRQHWSRRVA